MPGDFRRVGSATNQRTVRGEGDRTRGCTAISQLCRKNGFGLAAVSQAGANAFFTKTGCLDPSEAWQPNQDRNAWSKTSQYEQWEAIKAAASTAIGRHDPADWSDDARSIRRASVKSLARRCGWPEQHSAHVASLALELFDGAAPLHQLVAADRELLEYAALLHDIGEHVSHDGHDRQHPYGRDGRRHPDHAGQSFSRLRGGQWGTRSAERAG